MYLKRSTQLFSALFLGLMLWSCSGGNETTTDASTPEDEHEDAIQVEADDEVKRNPSRIQWNDHTLDVNFVLSGSTSLVVGLDRFGGKVSKGHQNVPSSLRVKQVEAADMDGDGFPEVLVYLNNWDKSDPRVLGFKSIPNSERLEALEVPKIPQAVLENYQQGDTLIPMESGIEYRVNYVANGAPTTGVFQYVWDAEKGGVKLVEQR